MKISRQVRKTRLRRRQICRWIGLLSACLLTVLPVVACRLDPTTSFPALGPTTTATSGATQGSQAATTDDRQPVNLSVALPIGREALAALRLLYLAKKSGLINQESGQYIGQLIQLEDLQQFDGNLNINLISVSLATGPTESQIAAWRAAANMPDLVYCQDAAASFGLDRFLDLSPHLFNNPLLSAGHVVPAALESCRSGQILYGVPFLGSVPLIYLNRTLLNANLTAVPDMNWSWKDWQEFAAEWQQKIQVAGLSADATTLANLAADPAALNNQLQQAVFLTDDPADLLSYLPAAMNQNLGWATWDGRRFNFDQRAFADAAGWLRQALPQGSTLMHLDSAQLLAAFGSRTARQSGRILMWTGDSADIASWRQQAGFQVTECLMPVGPMSGSEPKAALTAAELLFSQRTPLLVRSLLVSRESKHPELAAEIAAFIALDTDSLLMQSRFQLYEGLVPLIRDPIVWPAMVGRQLSGSRLIILQDKLAQAYCSGQQLEEDWDAIRQATIGAFGKQLLLVQDPIELDTILTQLRQAAKALQEGSP